MAGETRAALHFVFRGAMSSTILRTDFSGRRMLRRKIRASGSSSLDRSSVAGLFLSRRFIRPYPKVDCHDPDPPPISPDYPEPGEPGLRRSTGETSESAADHRSLRPEPTLGYPGRCRDHVHLFDAGLAGCAGPCHRPFCAELGADVFSRCRDLPRVVDQREDLHVRSRAQQ